MDRENQRPIVAKAPKVILIIASALCFISALLPWLDFGYNAKADLDTLTPLYVIPGMLLLVLNALALITKKRGISLAANILGIVSGLIIIIYTGLAIAGSTAVYGFQYLTIAPWMAAVSSILLFIVSIVSIKKGKKKRKE